jgi:NAD(P)-dependent dehydrogenase (short-subunit alcohol dehydrogenase family)
MLVTGANKGLGYESARRLVEAGNIVYVAARDPELGRLAADRLGARFIQLDVTSEDSVRRAVQVVAEDEGRLDGLINNAGITPGPCSTSTTTTAKPWPRSC